MKKLLPSAAYACLYFVLAAPVVAETITFTGTLVRVYTDNGSGTYSGSSPGTLFSGSITYGDSASEASNIDVVQPISADYLFTGSPYGGTLTDGAETISTTGTNSQVGIANNDGMGDDAGFLNDLYGAGSTDPADVADVWGADSSNGTYNFGVSLYSLDTALYSGLDFQRFPPPLNATDFEIFYVEESDSQGIIYLAAGIVSSVTTSSLSTETVMPGHYLAAGSPGDTWTYENMDASQSVSALSAITSGTNVGRLKLGNSSEWIIYDFVNNIFTIYGGDFGIINPPLTFPDSARAGQMLVSSGEEFLFLKAPSITVKAGTFYDVLVLVWLDSEFGPNIINTQLGLDSSVAAAVTDVDWYDSGVGLVKQMGVDAATGDIDGGKELLGTSIDSALPDAELWPMDVGQVLKYSRTDGDDYSWDVELAILEQVTKPPCNSEQFFHFSNSNYDNAGAVKDNYVRSTVDTVYFCDDVAGELAAFRANVPVGTIWTIGDEEYQRIENRSIHVPYFGQDASGNDIFREAYVFKMRDVVEDSPSWYEYFVPGTGLVQEVDEWTDNPPKILKLVSISIPDAFPWELFIPAIQAGTNNNRSNTN